MATVLFAASLAVSGCGKRAVLTPAPGTAQVPGGAAQSVSGITMTVIPSVDDIDDLVERVEPLEVTITNTSSVPLLVRYNHFALIDSAGVRHLPLVPFELDDADDAEQISRTYTTIGFEIAPHLRPWFPTLPVTTESVPQDLVYYQQNSSWLPLIRTTGMLEQAIPEGVLRPGGTLTGVIYFDDLEGDESRATFHADLVDARTGAQIGTIDIPFLVEYRRSLLGKAEEKRTGLANR